MSAYIGRYHRVRPLGVSGLGEPYVFDRGRAQEGARLIPAPYDKGETHKGFTRYGEWWRSPEGLWTPAIRGGAFVSGAHQSPRTPLFHPFAGSLTQAVLALDSNYANAVGGDAIGHRFTLNVADTLSAVYYYVTAFTGTAANVNDLNLELRNNDTTTGPGGTLHESQAHDPNTPSSVAGWRSTTGWTFAIVAGTQYWLVIGDADGNLTDFATLLKDGSHVQGIAFQNANSHSVQTTDGWTTVRTFATKASSIVLVFGSGRTLGSPFATSAAPASSTNQRGLLFTAPTSCRLYGANLTSGSTNSISGVRLWRGPAGPSGSPPVGDTGAITLTAQVVAGTRTGVAFETPPYIAQAEALRLVFTFSGNAAAPLKYQIGAGADATLRSAVAGGGAWYWTEANGTSDWSLDSINEFPQMDLYIDDFAPSPLVGQGLHHIMDGIIA